MDDFTRELESPSEAHVTEGRDTDALDELAPEKTRSDLEWERLLGAIVARCETAVGKDAALALEPPPRDELPRRLAEVQEAIATDDRAEPLPIAAVADAREAWSRAAHGGVLAPTELRSIAQVLSAARTLRRFLHARREALPHLFATCSTDPALDRVEDAISSAFDSEHGGQLADHASPRLRELRAEHAAARGRMVSRIEELIRRYSHILSDTYWTEREGRYVLPLRSDAHERFPGIVHASSASGATLFVEPRVLVPLGNRLKMLEGDVRREEEAVYAQLTGRVVEAITSVGGAIEAIGYADLLSAIVRLSRDLRLRFPDVLHVREGEGFVADLRDMRHPLLALEALEHKRPVVPSDIRVASGHALIVSGPNAGGKTVALKALGLAALMLRHGLPVAAQEGSRLGLVEVVLTDVGDDQSLQKSLSTFSAHVVNLARILEGARPGALVLLDELAGGTDPREGEALAAAVLDSLCRRGAAVVATTHYEGLKALAIAGPDAEGTRATSRDAPGGPRFLNASVGFDPATLSPTFKLALGVPGASSALAVARRYGVPSLVIERAERFLGGEQRSFEETLHKMNQERRALELARSAAEEEAEKARLLRKQLETELENLRQRDRRVLEKETDALFQSVRRAREDLRAAQARLRARKIEPEELRETERAVDSVARKLALGGELSDLLDKPAAPRGERVEPESTINKGARVWVPRLRAEAEVVSVQGDGQLRVAAGSLKLTVGRDEVRLVAPEANRAAPRGKGPRLRTSHGSAVQRPDREALPTFAGADSLPAIQTADNTCDLRGLRVDDAWPMLESFLDRALNEGQRVAFVVHGHGTGALREKIREELKRSRYVERFRAGQLNEGGEGVTVVWLA
ncbi:MAG: Smr/MutS family protein [Deltaproteobacteria bacterium]|nr:Smr/MutS family protein [Deltaproteobacteria bacterium]